MMALTSLPPLEELRVAAEAVELIVTLRAKHPGVEWALQACEYHEPGAMWRLMIVVHTVRGNVRQLIFVPWDSSPRKLTAEVDSFLSLF